MSLMEHCESNIRRTTTIRAYFTNRKVYCHTAIFQLECFRTTKFSLDKNGPTEMVRPKSKSPRDSFAHVRLAAEERKEIDATARSLNLKSISEYVRHLHKLHVSAS